MDPTVFTFIGVSVTNGTDAIISPAAASIMLLLKGIAVVCVTVYLTLTGYLILAGSIDSPFWSFAKQAFKIVIITSVALQIDTYTTVVVDNITDFELAIAEALSVGGDSPESIYRVLDRSLGRGLDIVVQCLKNALSFNPGVVFTWGIAALAVAIGTGVMVGLGGVIVILAKFAIAVLFAVGPLFLFALMFPITARFFGSWLTQLINYSFVVVIVTATLGFGMAAYVGFLGFADFSGDGVANPMKAATEIGILTAILSVILWQSRNLAAGLAGGMALATVSLRDIAAPFGVARDIVDPRSTRRDLESGHMVTGRRHNHLAAGNSWLNPRYRQHVGKNFMKQWGKAAGGKVKK